MKFILILLVVFLVTACAPVPAGQLDAALKQSQAANAALTKQQKEIEALAAQNAQLQKEIVALKASVESLQKQQGQMATKAEVSQLQALVSAGGDFTEIKKRLAAVEGVSAQTAANYNVLMAMVGNVNIDGIKAQIADIYARIKGHGL